MYNQVCHLTDKLNKCGLKYLLVKDKVSFTN